jgi:membrane protein required for colicin V production
MTAVDWIALAILVASLIVGMLRGFAREAFSLAAWIGAFVAVRMYSHQLAELIPGLDQAGLREVAAVVIIFVVVLVVAQLLAMASSKLLKATGLGGLNHFMGMLFGAGRAAAILVLLTLVAGMTSLPRSQTWQNSLVGRPMVEVARQVIPLLPSDLAALIRYS